MDLGGNEVIYQIYDYWVQFGYNPLTEDVYRPFDFSRML